MAVDVEEPHVWVFNGDGGRLPAAVFRSRESAEAWILERRCSGVLTAYPLDQSAYDWATSRGYFEATREEHSSPRFVQRFSSAHQPHEHYVDGRRSTG